MVKLRELSLRQSGAQCVDLQQQRTDRQVVCPRVLKEIDLFTRCDDEIAEAESVVHRLRIRLQSELSWGDMAVFIAQCPSRAIEESLVRWGILIVVGGLRFYDRREIKSSSLFAVAD